nr:hypothetical protein Iba_chr11bCG9820 [Ipomoea batatas]
MHRANGLKSIHLCPTMLAEKFNDESRSHLVSKKVLLSNESKYEMKGTHKTSSDKIEQSSIEEKEADSSTGLLYLKIRGSCCWGNTAKEHGGRGKELHLGILAIWLLLEGLKASSSFLRCLATSQGVFVHNYWLMDKLQQLTRTRNVLVL